jgi:hypothetical protein
MTWRVSCFEPGADFPFVTGTSSNRRLAQDAAKRWLSEHPEAVAEICHASCTKTGRPYKFRWSGKQWQCVGRYATPQRCLPLPFLPHD